MLPPNPPTAETLTPTPQMQTANYLQGYPAHLSPEPPSQARPRANIYYAGSFFEQPAAFDPQNSPRRTAAMGGTSPASPEATGLMPTTVLHQLIIDGHHAASPPSPSVPCLSPSPYQSHPTRAGRSYSFEDPMLPPTTVTQQEQQGVGMGNPGYAPYGNFQNNSGAAAGPGMYVPASPLQPRYAAQMPLYPGQHNGGGMGGQMGLYGHYYSATSPGPPIQTTKSNKGPDGANLFVFHIPNHFTNIDMYHLFCPYGTLLSIRIMVEKDTGRSRGFGFVSYDSPASAELAIEELNGLAIGNKRLKVQHKEIRPSDQQHHNSWESSSCSSAASNFLGNEERFSCLPPAIQSTELSLPQVVPSPRPAGADDGVASGVAGDSDDDGLLSPLENLKPLLDALPDAP